MKDKITISQFERIVKAIKPLVDEANRIESLTVEQQTQEMICPECGEEIQLGLSDEAMEKIKRSKFFSTPPDNSKEKVSEEEIDVQRIRECIEFDESLPDVDLDAISWGMEEGILISINEAKAILTKLKQ